MYAPTVEQLFKKYSNLFQFEEGEPEYLIDKEDFELAIVEFTKFHVEATLKAAAKNCDVNCPKYCFGFLCSVNKDSILNSYPLTNIK